MSRATCSALHRPVDGPAERVRQAMPSDAAAAVIGQMVAGDHEQPLAGAVPVGKLGPAPARHEEHLREQIASIGGLPRLRR